MRANAKKSLAQMDKEGDVDDGISVEIDKLKAAEEEEATEERTAGKAETPRKQPTKDYLLAAVDPLGNVVAGGHAPLDERLLGQDTIPDQIFEVLLDGAADPELANSCREFMGVDGVVLLLPFALAGFGTENLRHCGRDQVS